MDTAPQRRNPVFLDARTGERPTASFRLSGGRGEAGDHAPFGASPRRLTSAADRLSIAQLLRAFLLMVVCGLCLAFFRSEAAKVLSARSAPAKPDRSAALFDKFSKNDLQQTNTKRFFNV